MQILNGSTPVIPILMVDATDGATAETGLTLTVEVSKNGGAFAAATNSAAEISDGWYTVTLTATETGTDGPLLIRATGTGAAEWRDYHQVYSVFAANVTQFGGSAGTFAGGRPAVNTSHIAGSAVNTASAQLGVNVVQVSGDATAADNLEAAADGTGYNLGGGDIVAASVTAGVTVSTNNDKTGYSLATTPPTANQIADALLDRTDGVETNRTPRQALRLMLAALAGKLSGAATTTVTIRDTNDSKDRITATVDSDGNRSSVSYDAS